MSLCIVHYIQRWRNNKTVSPKHSDTPYNNKVLNLCHQDAPCSWEKKTVLQDDPGFLQNRKLSEPFWLISPHTYKVRLTWNLVKHPKTVPYSFMWERNLETSKSASYSRISFSMLWAFLLLYNKHFEIPAGLATSFWVPAFFPSLINHSLLERAVDWALAVLSSNASSDPNKSILLVSGFLWNGGLNLMISGYSFGLQCCDTGR